MSQESNVPLASLGFIVTTYSRLEWALSGFIVVLLHADRAVGTAIVAGMPASQKITLLGNLFRVLSAHYPATDVPQMDRALSMAHHAIEARNSVMHSTWWDTDDEGNVTRLKATAHRGKGPVWKREPANQAELNRIGLELSAAFDALTDLMRNHFERAVGRTIRRDEPYGTTPGGEGTLWGVASAYATALSTRERSQKDVL